MRTTSLLGLGVLAGAIAIAGAAALVHTDSQAPASPPNIPADPHKHAVSLLHAQRFDLDQPYRHRWRKERPAVRSGWLLVLSADPALTFPRQAPGPILHVGAQTGEAVNAGYPSGNVVVIVPGDFLLEDVPIFFGAPGLPEEIAAADIDRQLRLARTAGVTPPSVDQVARTTAEPLRLSSYYELHRRAIDLVERYAPEEQDLIRGQRVPVLR